jgi:hypothetical protein
MQGWTTKVDSIGPRHGSATNSMVRILTVSRHGLSAEVKIHRDPEVEEGRPRRGEIHLAEKILPGECLVEDRQRRSCLVLVSAFSGLDIVRIEVDVQKVRQGLHIASVVLGPGGPAKARRIQVQTTAASTEARENRLHTESSPDHRELSSCGAEREEMIKRIRPEIPF